MFSSSVIKHWKNSCIPNTSQGWQFLVFILYWIEKHLHSPRVTIFKCFSIHFCWIKKHHELPPEWRCNTYNSKYLNFLIVINIYTILRWRHNLFWTQLETMSQINNKHKTTTTKSITHNIWHIAMAHQVSLYKFSRFLAPEEWKEARHPGIEISTFPLFFNKASSVCDK